MWGRERGARCACAFEQVYPTVGLCEECGGPRGRAVYYERGVIGARPWSRFTGGGLVQDLVLTMCPACSTNTGVPRS